MVKTSEVFTPTKKPTITSVTRAALWDQVEGLAEQGGAFISVMGTTKLGKSTLAKSVMQNAEFHAYIPGQNLTEGASALWARLASDLGIPAATTTGKVIGNKAKWSFMARFGIKAPGISTETGLEIGGEHHSDKTSGSSFEMDTPSAVTEAMGILAEHARSLGGYPPIIVIDDFHFVVDVAKRRELILALRPVSELDVTVILATLPGREDDPGFHNTNVGGRHYPVTVPVWDDDELREIASTGFDALNVSTSADIVDGLIEQSHGSPQIMQQLCFNLCRLVNGVKDDAHPVTNLRAPSDWSEFYRSVKDPQSASWLEKLGLGLTERRPRKVKAELPDGSSFDGYQLILWALHQMGAPSEVTFLDLRNKIGELPSVSAIGVARFALEQKAKNMNVVASREMTQALTRHAEHSEASEDDGALDAEVFTDEEVSLAALIPQPVLEVVGTSAANMKIRILDPLLAYTLNWHPESFDR